MRVNMDSSIVSDPRFKIMAKMLSKSWREIIGSCFLLWLACYERRSERLSIVEADASAEIDGFAQAMLTVGLAHAEGTETLIVHGVVARIDFLNKQRVRGAKGGRSRVESARNEASAQANAQANASAIPSERLGDAEALASRTAQANTPALTPSPSPSPAQKETPTEFPPLPPELDTVEFRTTWADWEQHRRESRKPIKPTARKQQLKELAAMGSARAIAALRHSIAGSYQGIYEPAKPSAPTGEQFMDKFRRAQEMGQCTQPGENFGTAGPDDTRPSSG